MRRDRQLAATGWHADGTRPVVSSCSYSDPAIRLGVSGYMACVIA